MKRLAELHVLKVRGGQFERGGVGGGDRDRDRPSQRVVFVLPEKKELVSDDRTAEREGHVVPGRFRLGLIQPRSRRQIVRAVQAQGRSVVLIRARARDDVYLPARRASELRRV